MTQNIKI